MFDFEVSHTDFSEIRKRPATNANPISTMTTARLGLYTVTFAVGFPEMNYVGIAQTLGMFEINHADQWRP